MNTSEVLAFEAIGTHWEINTHDPISDDLRAQLRAVAEDFDRTWSRFRTDSLITQIAHAENGGRFTFPADSIVLFELYDRLAAATHGAVDPLVGHDLELLGYDASYTLRPDNAAIEARGAPDTWRDDVRRDGAVIVTDRPDGRLEGSTSPAGARQRGHHPGALHPQGQGRPRPDRLPRTVPAAHHANDVTRPTRRPPLESAIAVFTATALACSLPVGTRS